MVVVVNYDTLESLPPIMSLLLNLKTLGESAYFIGMASSAGHEFLVRHCIPYCFLPERPERSPSRLLDYLHRAPKFLPRRRFLKEKLDSLRRENPDLIVWFQQVKSAALLGRHVFDFKRRIVTLFEVYDRVGANWMGFDFGKFLASTPVVVPEYNRSWILKCYYNLARRPFVIENKQIPMAVTEPPESVCQLFKEIGNDRPVILYQGALVSDRRDVITVIETIAKCRTQYAILILANWSPEVDRLCSAYGNVYYHPLIAAPNHLTVTARASVGIAIYNGVGSPLGQLNAVYCAPNKIYEYAQFGVPTLGNNIPGLKYSIEVAGAGLCCEMSAASILAAVDRLVSEHDHFAVCAKEFYAQTDTLQQTRAVLGQICK